MIDKPEGESTGSQAGTSGQKSRTSSGASTPLVPGDEGVSTNGSEVATTSAATTAATAVDGVNAVPAKGVSTSTPLLTTTGSTVAAESSDVKSKNMVGKINNLITVDTENIIEARDFLAVSECIYLEKKPAIKRISLDHTNGDGCHGVFPI
jgi:hypothetical protein